MGLLSVDYSPAVDYGDDEKLVRRIQAAYRYSAPLFTGHGESMWAEHSARSKDVCDVIASDDFDRARELLRNPATHDLLYGLDQVNQTHYFAHLANSQDDNAQWGKRVLEKITRLGEALAVIKAANPEMQFINSIADAEILEQVLNKLDDRLGFKLDFPNPYPGEYGLVTSRGVADHRTICAIYQAWLLKACGGSVLEIGAGNGRTAYYASKMGVYNYTIVDLPHANIGQANFLGRVMGPGYIQLAGENGASHRVHIVWPGWLDRYKGKFNVVLNADSLPEMDRAVALGYIKKIATCANIFISINHEAHAFSVMDLIAEAGVRPKNYQRYPFWIRDGYVEEIFTF